jgi:hypothetical protein
MNIWYFRKVKKMNNDDFIFDFCEQNNLVLIEILNYNSRKDTSVFSAIERTSSEKVIIKLCGKNTSEKIYKSFLNEKFFYESKIFDYTPNLIKSNSNYIILEYLEHVSLTEYVNNEFFKKNENHNLSKLLEKSKFMLNSFHSLNNSNDEKKIDSEIIVDRLFDRLGNLISSGPKNTKKIPLESFIVRQIFKINTFKIQKKFLSFVISWKSKNIRSLSKYGHNDLHCNNVLASDTLKLIDFENLTSPGIWILDILYFYATLYALFSSKPIFQNEVKEHTISLIIEKDPRLVNDAKYLVNLFFNAADVNSRFRIKNKGFKILKIIKFFSAF